MTNKFRQLCNPHQHPQSLDTASPLEKFVDRDIELGSGVSTMTDHGTLGGAVDFYTYCKKKDDKKNKKPIQPVIGLEGYVFDPDCDILRAGGIDGEENVRKYNKYYHLTMHAQTEKAYLKLVSKLSHADLNNSVWAGQEKKPLFTWKDLEELGQEDMTFCSSCLAGICANHLKKGRPDLAEAYYARMRSVVKPGNFYVEVFPHVTTHQWTEGCFVTLKDGRVLRFRDSKRFDVGGQEIPASLLHRYIGKTLTGTYHYQKMEALDNPCEIISVKLVKDFVQDECTPFAPDGDNQLSCNRVMLELAAKYGDKVLVSLDSHYSTVDYRRVQDIKNLQAGWGPFFGNYHIYSSDEAFTYFSSKMGTTEKQYEEWIDNSYEWASKFKDFKITKRDLLPRSRYPQDTVKHVYELIEKHGRYDGSPEQKERLEREITLFHDNGTQDLLPYFFTAEDFCAYYASKGYLSGPGRGSAAGVLLSYLLEITHVNPLKHNLSLDRFITLDRILSGKMPDIDTDFGDVSVLTAPGGYLDTFFKGKAAQISTVTTMKLKSSIRDVFRQVHKGGIPYEVDRLAFDLPDEPQGIKSYDFVFGYEDTDGNHIDGEIETNKELAGLARQYPTEWELIVKCLAVVRGKSRHASAFVLSEDLIDSIIPLTIQKDDDGAGIVTQYSMTGCETVGGLKFDFLGLKMLKDIQDAVKLIQQRNPVADWSQKSIIIDGLKVQMFRVIPHEGKLYDIYDLPYSKEVFLEISEGKTETVFQLNTSSARKWLKEFDYYRPDTDVKLINGLDDVGIFTALDRPGPLDAKMRSSDGDEINMLQEYARRVRGIQNPEAIKIMEELLPETFGVMVTQEQLQRLYQNLTGCNGIEANTFRDKIGKKKMEEVMAMKPYFIKNAEPKIGLANAEAVWSQIVTCGNYCIDATQRLLTDRGSMSMLDVVATPGVKVASMGSQGMEFIEPEAKWCSGEKEVLEVELEDGTIIRATGDHKFLYEGGWVTLNDLISIGEMEISYGIED
jgi:DNA polymerase III alpha subunit